jgi:hypothetical protein
MTRRLIRLTRVRRQRRTLPLAPFGRRLAATLVDAPLVIGYWGVTVAFVAWPSKRRRRDMDSEAYRRRSKRAILPMSLGAIALSVHQSIHRSPGQRLAHIRVVDAETGAPLTVRQASVWVITPLLRDWLLRRLMRPLRPPPLAPPDEPVEDHGAALAELKRIHADDRDAFREATIKYYRVHGREWSCLRALIRPLTQLALTLLLQILIWRRWPRRSLADVLAGTVVILDR